MPNRKRLLILALLWLFPFVTLVLAFSFNWMTVWSVVGIHAITPNFIDLRVISAGIQTFQHGGDPLIRNPFDPWPAHRPMNYPRIWLYLLWFSGANDKYVPLIAILFSAMYLICISRLIIQSRTNLEAFTLMFSGVFYAGMLAIERGNIDLAIFALLFLGCTTSRKSLKSVVFFLATLLKIFPFAAMVADTVRRPARQRSAAIGLVLLAVGILALQWRDLNAIRHSTPVTAWLAYGVLCLKAQVNYLVLRFGLPSIYERLGWVPVIFCWVVALLTTRWVWIKPINLHKMLWHSKEAELFSIFAGIYVFTYLIGSNFNYRLIFLAPTLPLAFELARNPRHLKWGAAYIISVIVVESVAGMDYYPNWNLLIVADMASFAVLVLAIAFLTEQARALFANEAATVSRAVRQDGTGLLA
jgi:hypothetical protein